MGSGPVPRGAQLTPVWHPSPNCGPRRDGAKPDLVVLHYTAMDDAEKARDWLCNEEAQVSAHYVIAPDGTVWHLVDEDARAWHAGAGAWGPVEDVNSRSIGIEIANTGSTPFSANQVDAVESLLAEILQRHDIPPERVIGHSDMAPGRKIDPGPRFDWQRLARQGLSIWPDAEGSGEFMQNARVFGYTADVPEDALLNSFRLRFRPGAAGPLDDTDRALMANLAQRWPVKRS
ncbi:N-acetylmuramoyl-L-alanine amidase [Marivita hallyeonensis]|uniref:N-acetylmuramoyl-L-alanine amidase n=1 Tax=Marivita hallyeonensis TaxID=996342 RepID=A0A1M5RSI6_9RHOB|nr:N-acetylmuramoyl-L-alanine amidase [Marivita hallyeonensis]SHH29140.1 N-acetylmuramoyl-L-alanine amidase [Marivita hallyeonensis]